MSITIRQWQHKTTKKKLKVVPWWEIPDAFVEGNAKDAHLSDDNRLFKIGCLVQVGWLLENEHDIYIGVGLKAAESFNDLGEWKPKKKAKRK